MGISTPLAPLPIAVAYPAGQTAAPAADFDTRWATWIARGRTHEQRVRQRFLIWGPVIAIGVAIAFALLRS